MNETITINNRTYTVIDRFDFLDGHSQRFTLETKSGDRKTAIFYDGAFEFFETKSTYRKGNLFSRVNMRK